MTSKKLLYILPDVTYVAELLPTKKEYTFAVQSFRQINGDFIDDNDFISANIEKLFSKFSGEEFDALILPDFLFTNTIVSIPETNEVKVKEQLKGTLLPSLGLSTTSHFIETFVLTQFKGQSKVQLSALEKSVLGPIRLAAKENSVKIAAVSPLSWTAKSIISLEPSISVLQVGSKLYSAQHYIGLDQTTVAELSEVSNIAETIKTLKGAEPSIQTIYLLSNDLVEEQLKELLTTTLPIQQLASFKEEDAKMPSHIRYIIESGMKTLSIPDFLVPQFEVGEPTAEDQLEMVKPQPSLIAQTEDEDEDGEEDNDEVVDDAEAEETAGTKSASDGETLPLPTPRVLQSTITSTIKSISLDDDDDFTSVTETSEEETLAIVKDDEIASVKTVETTQTVVSQKELVADEPVEEPKVVVKHVEEEVEESEEEDAELAVDLSQFSQHKPMQEMTSSATIEEKGEKVAPKKGKLIKNESGVGTMLKMVFITLAVFFATVAVGVGVGLGLLKFSQGSQVTEAPVVLESPQPTPSPTPTPSPVVAVDATTMSGLIVNATTKAGYAGTVKADLATAKFKTLDTGNAKGEYETGNYILVEKEVPGFLELVEKATELKLKVVTEDMDVEDTAGKYDFVLVLAE